MKKARYQDPPWITTPGREPGTTDILAAGRPGIVLAGLPHGLAVILVNAANDYIIDNQEERLKAFIKTIDVSNC
jgi:hypothetical protein